MRQETTSPYRVEDARIHGDLGTALRESRAAVQSLGSELTVFSGLSQAEMEELMSQLRIQVVTLGSFFERQWNGDRAADFLKEAKDVFDNYYFRYPILKAAGKMDKDSEGNEYQMSSEMKRDRGEYWMRLYSLSGDKTHLNSALFEFTAAGYHAEEGTAAKGLARMEYTMANRRMGKGIHFPLFTEAYQQVVSLSPQAGGWDRQRKASLWYYLEARRSFYAEVKRLAWSNLREADEHLGIDPRKDLLREDLKRLLRLSRRLTFTKNPKEFEVSH